MSLISQHMTAMSETLTWAAIGAVVVMYASQKLLALPEDT